MNFSLHLATREIVFKLQEFNPTFRKHLIRSLKTKKSKTFLGLKEEESKTFTEFAEEEISKTFLESAKEASKTFAVRRKKNQRRSLNPDEKEE